MILCLRGARPAPADDARRSEGRKLSRLVAHVHTQIASHSEPDADLEYSRAVPHDEQIVAEAISVVAQLMLERFAHDPAVDLDDVEVGASASGGRSPALDGVVEALEEGRWLMVVNYHNTPAGTATVVREELARYGRQFAPVTFEALTSLFVTGEWPAARPPLIPVFYEGYRNNYEHGGPAAEAAGLAGWFFLITDFLSCAPADQISFARTHDIGLAEEELQRDRIAMTWAEAAELAVRHVVTSHTATHCTAASVRGPERFAAEVAQPSELVRRVTGRPSPAHAWLFGTGLGRSTQHDQALRDAGYRFCFSNLAIDAIQPDKARDKGAA